jgi:hypothetical protein
MSTVARNFASIPARSASETWSSIVSILAPDDASEAHKELISVSGLVNSIISRETCQAAPMVVFGGPGPRIRIYCTHGEDAISGEGTNEASLATVPTQGSWSMSLPCLKEDLTWISDELKKKSSRISAREMSEAVSEESNAEKAVQSQEVNMEAYLRK